MSAGTDTDGAVVSWIVIVADFDTEVLSSVVVLHVTVVWPSGKCPVTSKSPTPFVPAGTSQLAASGVPVAGSNAFTLYVASAPSAPVASTVASLTRSAGGAGRAATAPTSAATATPSRTSRRRPRRLPLIELLIASPS